MRELAFRHRRFGYRRLCVLLRREVVVNHKRVYRLYREEGLNISTKRRKKSLTASYASGNASHCKPALVC